MKEYFRFPEPIKGKRYNAVLATYVTWDYELLKHRYFADQADRRYLGTFLDGFSEGTLYWGKFDREGSILRLDYDNEKTLCFELVDDGVEPASIYSDTVAKIDSSIKRLKLCCFSGCNNSLLYGGNNASPLFDGGCCDECNISKVVPARLKLAFGT
jgi:hypothetical protein